jgi:7-dehydrocholesterol reductase
LIIWYIFGVQLQFFNPASVYDNFAEILTFLTFFSLFMCVILYYKGLYFPSSADAGSTGHPIRDFFWGTELHPSFNGYYLKQYVNCRLSMTGWIVIIMCGAYKQYELYGFVSNSMIVSVALQTIYIAKFFVWEHGYFNSIDIMHDRFGFYIYWGVTVWVPSLYTLASIYLVKHPHELSTAHALFLFVVGVTAIYLNYATDEQRLRFRETNGNTTIWGKKPDYILAKYTTGDGKEHNSMLLVSGFWGMSRHFNYVPEITLALFWSLPALFNHLLPYIYVLFLTGLLLHRSWRDEERCAKKYGRYYEEYRRRVPYYLIPYVY